MIYVYDKMTWQIDMTRWHEYVKCFAEISIKEMWEKEAEKVKTYWRIGKTKGAVAKVGCVLVMGWVAVG